MKFFQKIFFSLIFLFFSFPSIGFCEEVFIFHFERLADNSITLMSGNQASIEKKEDPDFSIVNFLKNQSQEGIYKMDIYDVTGSLIGSFFIENSEPVFSFTVPFFGIAERYTVHNVKTGKLMLDGKLDTFVTCNNNAICEAKKGENINSCVSDCGSQGTSKETLSSQENKVPEIPSEVKAEISTTISPYFIALLVGIFLIIFLGTFLLIRYRLK